ncbi:MAG: hypothetical protein AAF721_16435 [Myxococcota bacterium]
MPASTHRPASAAEPTGARRRGLHHWVLIVIVLASGALCRWGSADESPLDGEFDPLIRGVALWSTGDARLSYDVPPLADALSTIAIDEDLGDVTAQGSWDTDRDAARTTYRMVRKTYTESRAALMQARKAATWFLLAAVVYAYAWALRIYGWSTAVAAATLIGFNPVLLGHAGFLGEDLPAGVFMFVTLGELARWASGHGTRGTPWITPWIAVPCALSLALLTSHRAWLLVPVLVAVAVFVALTRGRGRARRLAAAAGYLGAVGLIVTLALNLGFGFRDTGLSVAEVLQRPEPQSSVSDDHRHEMLEHATPLPRLPAAMPLPLPYTEIFGLGSAVAHVQDGDSRALYRGRKHRHGHAAYFPSLLAFKTPLPVLALLLAGLAVAGLGRRASAPRPAPGEPAPNTATWILALTTVAWFLWAMRFGLNIGVGQVLHAELLLCMLGAIAFGSLYRRAHGRAARAGVGSLLLLAATVGIGAGPRHRAYFNALVGAEGGVQVSAVGDDLGQDRAALAALLGDRPAPLWVHHGSWATVVEYNELGLKRRRVRCKTQPPGGTLVVVHRRHLQTARRRCFQWREGRHPLLIVGHHIEVYWLPVGYPGGPEDVRAGAAAQ